MEPPYAPLSESCAKALGDKVYEKRKVASQEIEKMVIEFNNKNNATQIRKLIEVLSNDYATSRDANRRKGALIGLAATGLGLGKDSDKYVNELVTPIMNCLSDPDLRVRYFACESLYNVVKVARAAIIPYFPELFAALSRLVTDSDQMVKDGSELLDRLLKDIVTESYETFNLEAFIPLLRERMYVNNPFARQYVISWISILNAVPDINMVNYLTEILDGLFVMLEDNTPEIQPMCENTISQFLKSIRNDSSSVRMEDTINTLITHAQSLNELIKSIAISWIREFVQIFGPNVLPYASGIFTAILPCLEYNAESKRNIKECAVSVNNSMMQLVSSKEFKTQNVAKIDLRSIMEVLSQYLTHNSVHTKIAVLKWIHHLFLNFPNEMALHDSNLNNNLLATLSDNSDEVVLQSLCVLAEIINSQDTKDLDDFNKPHYRKFLLSLLNLFTEDKLILENRASLIISSDVEITLELLCELDKLVQLIESPIFAALRLTLVSKSNNCADAQYLAHALFGILMLLPQTVAFETLRNRLQCVPTYWSKEPIDEHNSLEYRSGIDFSALRAHFIERQKSQRAQRLIKGNVP
ncbi:protein VAC14 homolog isoform X2 [Drosophila mojavensis]|uniref:protein VAC14 homolog isoform X2 n=1 Tax=Drosophila mojavensis TaxID=7230 RepID=UPI0013EE87D6|nr:protein VAC14 homolog isoform X2 [Drosophila mojavensis]